MKSVIMMSLLALIFADTAHAHSRLKASEMIKIRGNDPGIKIGPCGGLARVTPAVINPGSTITVYWEETIYHPGRFEFYFSEAGDQNFVLLKTIQNNSQGTPLPHQFNTTLTLPTKTCDNCTLQMIQVMTENPNNPTNYYSCADMQLKSATNNPDPTPTPTDPTTPTPADPDCH
jgi:Chitin binding domain.